ncbi:MAG: dienelactone hydrolase family protein [Acidimicrobiia bacterium]|nr:dienelactone hydrolase family protein [Acidimicrobiia bacterium]
MSDGSGTEAAASPIDRAPVPVDPTDPTALEALHALATTEVDVTPTFRHREVYTTRGLLSVLWHEPATEVAAQPAAIVACGGAMGGLLGPGHAFYHHLGERWSARGVRTLRVGYREPNNLDLCAHDLACGIELARDAGAERVVVMGHSFGGAVAIRAAVVMPASVVGVVTFATQSAGCEVAGALGGLPLLLFHGDQDELLPAEASHTVQAIAGAGEVVIIPGDGHLLGKSDDVLTDRLDEWLPGVLGVAADTGEVE